PTFGLCPPDFPRLAPAPLLGSGSLPGSCDQGIGRLGVPCPIILDVYLLMAGLILMSKHQKPHDPVGPIVAALESWKPAAGDLDHLLASSSRSLEEVAHLTEYQDDKANRILTAMAFLSAFVVD